MVRRAAAAWRGELLAVGVQTAGRQLGIGGLVVLQLTALRHFEEVTDGASQIVVVVNLEVLKAALFGPAVKSDRGLAVALDVGLIDGVVQNGGECCGRVVELTLHQHGEQVVRTLAAGIGHAAALQTLDGHVAQGHVCHLLCAIGGLHHGGIRPRRSR